MRQRYPRIPICSTKGMHLSALLISALLINETDVVLNCPADPPLVPDGDLPAPATPTPTPDLPPQPLPDTGT